MGKGRREILTQPVSNAFSVRSCVHSFGEKTWHIGNVPPKNIYIYLKRKKEEEKERKKKKKKERKNERQKRSVCAGSPVAFI